MEIQHYFLALLAGLLAGLAARRILLPGSGADGALWQTVVLPGVVAGGAMLTWLAPVGLPVSQAAPVEFTAAAGLLIGFVSHSALRPTKATRHPAAAWPSPPPTA
jgi:ABC-type spermidine/putrescine transport system permease subunit II